MGCCEATKPEQTGRLPIPTPGGIATAGRRWKGALAMILVAVLIFFAVYNGIREVDHRLVERVQTLGGGRRELIQKVYIPSLTAGVLGNLKVAVGFAFAGAVVGDFVSSSRGLKYLLQSRAPTTPR